MEEMKIDQQKMDNCETAEVLATAEELLEKLKRECEELDVDFIDICEKGDPVSQTEIRETLEAHGLFLKTTNRVSGTDVSKTEGARRAVLDGKNLKGIDLSSANLAYSCMADSYLDEADLRDAQLQGADLRKTWLRDADLRGANLSGAHLHGAHLAGADLRDADLSKADLSGANLCGTLMAGACLAGSNMIEADLAFVDWSGVDFDGVDLRGAFNLDSLDVLASIAAAHGMPNKALEYDELQVIADEFSEICPHLSVNKLACEILVWIDLIKKATYGDLVDEEPFMFPTFARLLHKAISPHRDVVIETIGDSKIAVIKAVREVTGLGLKEAKTLVEGAPSTLKADVDEDEAVYIKGKLEAAGCTISIA